VSVAVRERPAHARASTGGVSARRAVIRWAWRLLWREWRQQLLILALITVAVAATFIGAAVATNAPGLPDAGFGTAKDMATFPSLSPGVKAAITELGRRFGRVEVISDEALKVPGSVALYSLRAQNPHGAFGQPMLSLVSGHYPHGSGQVALTSGLASELHLRIGGTWRSGSQARRVTGIVANPQNLLDEFALVAPGQLTTPTMITVLFDSRGASLKFLGPLRRDVVARNSAPAVNVLNPVTISLAAATLGMLLIAMVSVGGFTVLAQRRLRAIGMLGAQGATEGNIALVISANGVATGVAGATAGFVLGLLGWLAYRPRAENSAHHVIGAFQLPWLVIFVSMALAVVAAYLAAIRPAWSIARVPIVAALAGRPPAPRQVRRWAAPAGAGLAVIAFFLIGFASEQSTSAAAENGNQSDLFLALVAGLVMLSAGVVLVAPATLALLARVAWRAPITLRLALRDLARYRARTGSALGAISLSLLIVTLICIAAAARFGNALDYAGPNLAANQMVLYTPAGQGGPPGLPGSPAPSGAQLAAMPAAARAIAATLGSADVVKLEFTDSVLNRAAPGRTWSGPVYVATPQLLHAFGITAADVDPDADILSMRPGLSTLTKMQFLFGSRKFGPGPGADSWPCGRSYCLANPTIEEVSALPSGTSAPNTVITERAVREFGLTTTTAGWLIQTTGSLTASQISTAQRAAAAAGLSVETRNSIPSAAEILDVATVFGLLLGLGILAMNIGLVRSETAGTLKTLTATGATGTARRAIAAATAGSLALTGAVVGTAAGYVAAIGFFRTSQLDTLSSLTSVPVTNLLLILVGMPLIAVAGGWLLAGREPTELSRLPSG